MASTDATESGHEHDPQPQKDQEKKDRDDDGPRVGHDRDRTPAAAPYPVDMSEIVPDDKDWTWTLERPCPDCGFDAESVAADDIANLVTAYTSPWARVLERHDVTTRPNPATWSPLEYACHVRDVCDLFTARVQLMLDEEVPTFANWDQDATAVASRYADQSPDAVAAEIPVAAERLKQVYAVRTGSEWDRRGLRSDGSAFTVLSLGRYGLHDLAHHLWDVGAAPE